MAESFLAAVLVSTAMLALGQSWQVPLLLGSIAMATTPASTLMVVRECNASGPLTEILLGVIGVNNILCHTAFAAVAAVIDLSVNMGSSGEILLTLYRSLYPLVWQLVGSVALGFLVGLLLATWGRSGQRARRTADPGHRMCAVVRRSSPAGSDSGI